MPGNMGYGLFFEPINVRLGTQNRISSGSLGMSGVGGILLQNSVHGKIAQH
jgi:hypothetical protein